MTIDISSVRLPDDAFWSAGADRALDPLVQKFKFDHFGVLVDAPHEVHLDGRSSLPLFAYYMGTYQQVATRSFLDNTLLVVMDPDRNDLRVAASLPDDGERIRKPSTVRPEDLPEGYLTKIREIDVRERTQIPWRPGRIISQVVLLDLPSNRVETRLIGGASAFVDLEKEKFLAAERGAQNPPPPFPLLPQSSFTASKDSPVLGEGFGLALQAPRVAVVDGTQPLFLHGAWRLPVFPEELVKPANTAHNEGYGLVQADGKTPFAACVTIHLLVVGTGQRNPFQYRLQLPVTQLDQNGNAPSATGYFTIDLTRLNGFPQSEQTVFIYAYAKDWATEPTTVGIIDRAPRP